MKIDDKDVMAFDRVGSLSNFLDMEVEDLEMYVLALDLEQSSHMKSTANCSD